MFSNMFILVFVVIVDMMETENNLRTIEAQIVQKLLKEQRASAKIYWFGYLKKRVYVLKPVFH